MDAVDAAITTERLILRPTRPEDDEPVTIWGQSREEWRARR